MSSDLIGKEIETEVTVLRVVGVSVPNPNYMDCEIYSRQGELVGKTVRSAALLRQHFEQDSVRQRLDDKFGKGYTP